MGKYGLDWINLNLKTKLEKGTWRNWKFVKQLRVKMHKFRTNDQNEKDGQHKG
jgi:hypothetical protein